jgi:hypothetical protein
MATSREMAEKVRAEARKRNLADFGRPGCILRCNRGCVIVAVPGLSPLDGNTHLRVYGCVYVLMYTCTCLLDFCGDALKTSRHGGLELADNAVVSVPATCFSIDLGKFT